MDTRVFCVYNLARGVSLSSKVTAADGVNEPLKILKVLVGGLGLDTESGLWISPLSAIPSVPRLFPFDLLYLDRDQRVIEVAEIVPGAEFPPYHHEVASALVLARHTLESTQTARGDRLIICIEDEKDRQIATADESDIGLAIGNARSSVGSSRGLLDRNGAKQGTAGSAVLTKPFTPVGTRLVEDPVPLTESANTDAVAMEHPADQPALGQAVVEAESAVSSAIETKGSAAEAISEAVRGEDPVSARLVPDDMGTSPGMPSVITGQQGGLEDLFSNWVDAPTSSRTWIPRNPRPAGAPVIPPEQGLEASTSPAKNAPEIESDSKASQTVPSEQIIVSANAAPNTATVSPATEIGAGGPQTKRDAPSQTSERTQALVATRSANLPPLQTTTFTVGNFGIWRASAPTAIGSLPAIPTPTGTRLAAPAVEEQNSKARERSAKEKATTAKAADSPAEALKPSSEQRYAGAAGLRREGVRAKAEAKVREPQEIIASKAEKDKTAPTSGAATQGIADRTAQGALAERAEPRSTEPLKVAADAPGAIPEKKLTVQVANNVGDALSVKSAEMADRPRSSASTGAGEGRLQKSQPEASATKAGISALSAASEPKPTKVEPKAVVPAQRAALKARLTASIGRTEANGKSKAKAGPASLGERFKRWLNPVVPVASDRRRAYRRYVPGMVAHYYSGGAPKPHEVADISMTGFYLLTEDRWMPETMIQMTLQKPCAKGERKQSITVLSRIVRRGSDGVAAQFVMPEDLDSMSHDIQPSQATDKFTLARFL